MDHEQVEQKAPNAGEWIVKLALTYSTCFEETQLTTRIHS